MRHAALNARRSRVVKEDSDLMVGTLFHWVARRGRLLSLLPLAMSSIFLAAPAVGREVESEAGVLMRIEAESYTRSSSYCGEPVGVVADKNASDGKAVIGLDCEGDWILLGVTLTEPLVFRDLLGSAGEKGLRRRFNVEFMPFDSYAVALMDTLTTAPGVGWG
jgi:hypothetical protein